MSDAGRDLRATQPPKPPMPDDEHLMLAQWNGMWVAAHKDCAPMVFVKGEWQPIRIAMTPEEREAQRRSFAYGNCAIENPAVTREMVDRIADDK